MKRLTIFLIAFLSVIMISLCAVLGIGLTMGGRFWNELGIRIGGIHVGNEDYTLVLEKEIPAEDIRSLAIDYSKDSHDVFLYQGTSDSVVVREYMNYTPEEGQVSAVGQQDGVLRIRGVRRNFFSFLFLDTRAAYTEIYLPDSIAGNLENVSVKTSSGVIRSALPLAQMGSFTASSISGDIFFPDVKAEKIQVSSTSGSIRLTSARAEEVIVSTTSGDILLEQTWGDTRMSTTSGSVSQEVLEGALQASSTSGDIVLGQVEGDMTLSTTSGIISLQEGQGRLEAESVSGDITAERLEGAFQLSTTSGILAIFGGSGFGKASSVSGDISIALGSLEGDLDISTTSGAVGLQLPEMASFAFDFDSTSGECRTFFDEKLSFNKRGNQADGRYGSGEHSVDVSTVSGDLAVTR